ncbi:hypothetical protein BP6252_10937 [Coleophoma cylindrospora]|uniref:Heterokaryon incompatibility domain-containing protein n=1 Tax=Coleophoma cylindrospora TaxID=1849047 RepID=A0A3D8QNL7_9HELO|nr:hypothetical protein BP6252_10937 [Coleophoma cylindrospora]
MCLRCRNVFNRSWDLFESYWSLVQPVEFLNHYGSLGDTHHGARPDNFCHVCALLWNSVGGPKRIAILAEDTQIQIILRQPVDMPKRNQLGRLDLPARFAFEVRHRYAGREQATKRQQLQIKTWIHDRKTNALNLQLFRGSEPVGTPGTLFKDANNENEQARLAHLSESTNSIHHFEMGKKWIRDCMQSHDNCTFHSRYPSLPTRLIHIETYNGQLEARLYIVEKADENLEYLTLSHRWGSAKPLTLNSNTFEVFQEQIPWDDLPKTFKDALIITHRLGFQYIWIDSLCILQDSKDDWARESALMGRVYAGSSCTIAATGSISSDDGCFKERDIRGFVDCTVQDSKSSSTLHLCMCNGLETSFNNQVNAGPLNARAWVFQERLLSRRVLHFASKMIFWECQTCIITESHPNEPLNRHYPRSNSQSHQPKVSRTMSMASRIRESIISTPKVTPQKLKGDQQIYGMEDFRSAFESLKSRSNIQGGHSESHHFTREWYELVSKYTLGVLTKPEDKLVAFSGIVSEIASPTKMTYISGLWKEYLIYNLLWSVDTPSPHRPDIYRAPSWSWASIDGMVKYEQDDDISTYECTKCARFSENIPSSLGSRPLITIDQNDCLKVRGVLTHVGIFNSLENDVRSGICCPLRDRSGLVYGNCYPDTFDDLGHNHTGVYVLEILRLSKQNNPRSRAIRQTLGIVLVPSGPGNGEGVFRRVGYFSSGIIDSAENRNGYSETPGETDVMII